MMKRFVYTLFLGAVVFTLAGCEAEEPSISIEHADVKEDEVTFDVAIDDPDDTLSVMDIVLLDEDSNEVTSLNETDLDGITGFEGAYFTNLAEATDYTIKVHADYTIEDTVHEETMMDTVTFETDPYLELDATFDAAEVNENEISFDLSIDDPQDVVIGLEVLLKGPEGNVVTTLDETDGLSTGMNEDVSFWNLHYETDYSVEVRADYHDGHMTREAKTLGTKAFETEPAIEPDAAIHNETVQGHAVHFDLELSDPSGILDDVNAVLYDEQDDEVARLSYEDDDFGLGMNEALAFNMLAYDTAYTMKVIADIYPDGTLDEDVVLNTHTFTTGVYEEPSGTLEVTELTEDSVTFTASLTDDAHTVTFPAVFIFESGEEDPLAVHGDDVLSAGENTSLSFTGLETGEAYDLVFMADYFDGEEETAIHFDAMTITPE